MNCTNRIFFESHNSIYLVVSWKDYWEDILKNIHLVYTVSGVGTFGIDE